MEKVKRVKPDTKLLLTPGPTPLPPSVSAKMAEPILHHRTHEFGAFFQQVLEDLRYVFRTRNTVLLMTASGTGGMESAAANLLSPGDGAAVISTGVFGDRWAKILRGYGLEPAVHSVEWGRAADPEGVAKFLKGIPPPKAVFLTHTDTSTGIVNDLKSLAEAVRASSDALIVVDSVSGLAGEELETDGWGLDVVVGASQKGLMCGPGLAYVSVSERAWKVADVARFPRFYFDWRTMRNSLPSKETPYTPAVNLVVAQAEALRLIRAEGLERVWRRTAELARYARSQGERLGLPLFAKDPCDILTALRLPEGLDGQKLVRTIREEEGISIAGGQEGLKGKVVRIAHMGHIRTEDVDRGFAALKKHMGSALDI